MLENVLFALLDLKQNGLRHASLVLSRMNLACFQENSPQIGDAFLCEQHLIVAFHDNASTLGYAIGMELIFEIRDAEEGGFYARALGHAIFTQAETWEELRNNALEAVSLHFEDCAVRPRIVQLHYVKDELIPIEAA